MDTQRTTKIDLLSKLDKENVKFFQFHIIPKVLKHFYRATSNKSFLLYLLFLELSNRKGFCYLNTKEVAQTFFEMTAKSICNWIKEMHNAGFITALYDAKQHFWIVRVNTKWHITLWEKYSDGSLEELLKASEKEISEEKLNKIIADAQEFAVIISENNENSNNNDTQTSTSESNQPSIESSNSDNENVNEIGESSETNETNANSANSNESSETNTNNADSTNAENANSANDNVSNSSESSDLKDSQSAKVENAENPNTNENGDNNMSATTTEMTQEAFKAMILLEKIEADKAKMSNFYFRFFNRPKKDKSKKVLVVTPYRTLIDETDTKNIKATLEQIKFFEKFERNCANDYGTSVSPIRDALKKADAIIANKGIVAQNKINEIIQNELNKVDFFDEKIWNKIDSVAISIIDYHNLIEIQKIHEKADSLGKEVRMFLLTTKNPQIRLEQIKNGIDDLYFYMKDADKYGDESEYIDNNESAKTADETNNADENAENKADSANSATTQEQNTQDAQNADTNTEMVSA